MVVGSGELHVGALEHFQSRRDIQQGQCLHPLAMVFGQAVRDARAAVVPDPVKPLMAQFGHDFDHVLRHGALGIIGMVGQTLGFRGAAVTAQISAHQAVVFGELRCNLVPARQGLRITV